MKKKINLEFRVGLFVITAIVVLLVFIFSQEKIANRKGYDVRVEFNYVGGLETGCPVRVSGVRVGEVKKIEIQYAVVPKVLVTLNLRQDVQLGYHSRITIRSLGIIGEKYVEISPSSNKKLIQPGEIIDGIDPLPIEKFVSLGEDILRSLDEVLGDVKKVVGDEDLQKNIKGILEQSNTAIAKASIVFDRIGQLSESLQGTNKEIRKILVANGPKIEKALDEIAELTASSKPRVESALKEIEGFASEGKRVVAMLGDKFEEFGEVGEDFKKTSAEIREFFENLENKGFIAKMLQDEELFDEIKKEVYFLQEATVEIKETMEKFNIVCSSADELISSVKDEKGSVGKFICSDELYNEVLDFVKDIKAHPWKLLIRKR